MTIALLVVGTIREAICLRCGRFLGAAPVSSVLIRLGRMHACEGERVIFLERHGKPPASADDVESRDAKRA